MPIEGRFIRRAPGARDLDDPIDGKKSREAGDLDVLVRMDEFRPLNLGLDCKYGYLMLFLCGVDNPVT